MAFRHTWDVPLEEALAIQKEGGQLVKRQGIVIEEIHTIAGVDVAYKDIGRAAIVVLTFPQLEVIEEVIATRQVDFPYIPGFLSFREIPVVLEALERLSTMPDVLMCDGQGITHPRHFGLASHLGVYLDHPTIGCAKSRLVGVYTEPGQERGDRSPMHYHGELVGMAVRSKPKTNPLFVSIGHRIDLETAVAVVLACGKGYRLPETTRLADKLSKDAQRAIISE
jgi:deoxyribonuclease V